jgi:acetylglutamate kinase
MEVSNFDRSQILVQALPYIQKYYNKIVVIKYGGNAMINEDLKQAVMEDIGGDPERMLFIDDFQKNVE